MRTDSLHAGDLVQCEFKGVAYEATIEAFGRPGWLKVKPVQPWATWRWVRSNQVVKKLERQEQLGVAG
jgi:hypothetical protein